MEVKKYLAEILKGLYVTGDSTRVNRYLWALNVYPELEAAIKIYSFDTEADAVAAAAAAGEEMDYSKLPADKLFALTGEVREDKYYLIAQDAKAFIKDDIWGKNGKEDRVDGFIALTGLFDIACADSRGKDVERIRSHVMVSYRPVNYYTAFTSTENIVCVDGFAEDVNRDNTSLEAGYGVVFYNKAEGFECKEDQYSAGDLEGIDAAMQKIGLDKGLIDEFNSLDMRDIIGGRSYTMELIAATRAMIEAAQRGLKEILIVFDKNAIFNTVSGIHTGKNNTYGDLYKRIYDEMSQRMKIGFTHLPSHLTDGSPEGSDKSLRLKDPSPMKDNILFAGNEKADELSESNTKTYSLIKEEAGEKTEEYTIFDISSYSGTFYAVKAGKIPGIYPTWSEAEAMVKGFSGAKYKKFKTMEDAENYMSE